MPEIPEVSTDDLDVLLDERALLLDVREPEEWDAGHAPDARLVSMGEVAALLDSLPRDRRIVAICRSGGRSGRVTEFLAAQGFDAWNLAGGMQAWAAAGRPVVTDDGEAGFVA